RGDGPEGLDLLSDDVGREPGRRARQARAQCAALGLQTPQARAEEARAEANQTYRYASCFNRPTPHTRQGQGDTLKGLAGWKAKQRRRDRPGCRYEQTRAPP